MYRQTSLRVPCAVCGIEQPLARMELSPRGGHWCWRCQMAAQVAAHSARRPRASSMRGAMIFVGVTAASIGLLYVGLWALAIVTALGHCC